MPVGNTYPAKPILDGEELFLIFTGTDTFNNTLEDITDFILEQVEPEIYMQDTAPSPMVESTLWIDTTTLNTFAAYNDGDSTQYVQIAGNDFTTDSIEAEKVTVIPPSGYTSTNMQDMVEEIVTTGVTTDDTLTGNGTPSNPLTLKGAATYIIEVALAQLDKNIALKTGCAVFPCPENLTLQSVFIRFGTAPTGSSVIYDINVAGSTILSTKITIEAGENNSLDATNQPVISSANIDRGAAITVDCDQIGATVAGQNPVLVMTYVKR